MVRGARVQVVKLTEVCMVLRVLLFNRNVPGGVWRVHLQLQSGRHALV